MAGALPKTNLKFLFIMEVFSGLSRGSYLVCIGWTTLIVTDDVSRVGQAFIIAMLTSLISGPLVGTVVDRHDRKSLVLLAHFGMFAVMALLGLVWVGAPEPEILWLFAGVAAVSALRMLHNSAHDGLIQGSVAKAAVVRMVARFRAVHLVATSVGTVIAGAAIERVSPEAGFLFSAGASLVLMVPMAFVASGHHRVVARGARAFLSDLKGGLEIYRSNRTIRMLAVLAAVSLPIGQLSNAILSSFVRDDLGKGSAAFGVVDAAWPMGGLFAAALLSLGIRRLSARHMEHLFALLAGVSTVGLSLCTSIPLLVVLHGAMGMTVWLCRIVIDGRVLEISTQENVGRAKTGIEMAFSFLAVVMCLSPTFVALPSTAHYFLAWGGVMILAAGALWMLDRSKAPRRH